MKEIFPMTREQALTYLQEELDRIADIEIAATERAGVSTLAISTVGSSLFRKTARLELQAEIAVQDRARQDNRALVVLTDVASPPWLYRRLTRILEEPSQTRIEAEEARKESPFSMENMWGMGPAAASAPREKGLGFGGDFFGGPKSRPMRKVANTVPPTEGDPGAFTIARDNGEF